MVFLLVVEDEPDFVEELQLMLARLPGPPVTTVSRSREGAFAASESGFFDLIILDLKIPTIDGALDANPAHGHAVFARARERAPGTPIFVLTGSPAEDFFRDMLREQQRIDVWGEGHMVSTVEFLKKHEFDKAPDILSKVVEAVRKLYDEVELDRGDVGLDVEDDRLVRIFARRYRGRRCVLSSIGGGLSGTKVVRLRVTDSGGALIHEAVAKLGSHEDVRDEDSRFDTHVSRLEPSATPRKLVKLEFGAKRKAGIFYGLAVSYDRSAFDEAAGSPESCSAVVLGIEAATSRWRQGVPQTSRPIRDVRRRVLDDSDLRAILARVPLPWVEDFEARSIQTNWCCTHGDLHGRNVLVSPSGVALIDYGDVGEGPASLDPITLELSLLFHPYGPLRRSDWPSREQREKWGVLDSYLDGCPYAPFVRESRTWALRVAAGKREVAASAYSYLIRQLKYADTNQELAIGLLSGVRAFFEST